MSSFSQPVLLLRSCPLCRVSLSVSLCGVGQPADLFDSGASGSLPREPSSLFSEGPLVGGPEKRGGQVWRDRNKSCSHMPTPLVSILKASCFSRHFCCTTFHTGDSFFSPLICYLSVWLFLLKYCRPVWLMSDWGKGANSYCTLTWFCRHCPEITCENVNSKHHSKQWQAIF